ncbi:Similar to ykt6: Synaptobrevin homolog YKT6 (Xenopus tropicalis) [Cotesia congregata]|uniref:Similar to ykt6: Synaptobrevin homolog YKT6 (Xenopus tropicalis) n=1 Tax=Cotesia congregata TaxID=51543 RepID=A0A8J2MJ04_COTCN|nr:Similar to ykt6: Synaptobrevin homolog YKT6 (Xenopus tropicalis) [Cotesia congregata]
MVEYMCHVYVRGDSLADVLITDHEYPNRVSHTLITKVLDESATKYPSNSSSKLNESTCDFSQANVYLAKYQNVREADLLTKIQNDVDEMILHNTSKVVLQRGEKFDYSVKISESLSMQSKAFYKTARN